MAAFIACLVAGLILRRIFCAVLGICILCAVLRSCILHISSFVACVCAFVLHIAIYLLLFLTSCTIIAFVRRISPSEIFLTKLYPLLIIYTPLMKRPVAPPLVSSILYETITKPYSHLHVNFNHSLTLSFKKCKICLPSLHPPLAKQLYVFPKNRRNRESHIAILKEKE